MGKYIFLFLSLISFTLANTLDKIRKTHELVIGVKYDAPPFGFLDVDGKVKGFDVDLSKYVADYIRKKTGFNFKVRFAQVTSKTRIPLLVNGNVDLVAATMTAKVSRDETIDFSIIYFVDGAKLLVRKNSNIKGVEDLVGKRVAVVQGATTGEKLKKVQPKVRLVYFQEYPQAFLALKQRKVDAVATDSSILAGLKASARHPERYKIVGKAFSYEPYGMGIRENDSDFRDLVNWALMDAIRNGNYFKIYNKWFGPQSKYHIPLTPEVKIFLKMQCFPE
ncbi:MAG TPA: transporter substrate-binding domain-containing protein [Aquificae bacterium]|nr:transporter substrate-binding domain-containing protein [Aquificota bacterium]